MESILDLCWSTRSLYFLFAFVCTVLIAIIFAERLYVDIPKIRGLPEIPEGELLAGHLYQLGDDHATTAESWAARYKWPVFQIRMGRRRTVILNSFEAAREWMIKNQAATLDRPWFYTFHGVLSASSAATIGTSPWDERTKKRRRVVGSFTTAPEIKKSRKMLDVETSALISGLYHDSEMGKKEIMPHVYQKRLSLNIMTTFCYGMRFGSINDPLFLQILSDAGTIASFRSTQSNPQDFIPHLRYLSDGERTATAMKVRDRRDSWLAKMFGGVRDTLPLKLEEKKSNVAEMLLTNENGDLTEADIKTILGGLMSGGFETLFSTLIITIGVLASKEGQKMQQAAFENIMNVYQTPEEAYELCLTEEKCDYICGLVKEALRFYPPLKLITARQTYKDFEYQGVLIPKGVLVYVNAQAANRDKNTYGPDADEFRPERWTGSGNDVPPPYHYAFGAGARMCTAIKESETMPANTDYIQYKEDPAASNSIASEFKAKFIPRDPAMLERCFETTRTAPGTESIEIGMSGISGL